MDEGDAPRARRRYHSPMRQQRAAETRLRVLRAAGDAIAGSGYAGATLAMIADAAGVSVDTVVGVGTKPYLLLESFRLRAMGEGGSASVEDRGFAQEIFAIEDPDAALDALVDVIAQVHAASADLWLVIRATAPTEPRVAEVFAELRESRDHTFAVVSDWLHGLGAIAAEVREEERAALRTSTSLVLSAESYLQLTRDWGYRDDQYRAWLRAALRAATPPPA